MYSYYSPFDIRIIFGLDPCLIFPLFPGPPFRNALPIISPSLQCFKAGCLERQALICTLLDREATHIENLDFMIVRTEIVDRPEVLAIRRPAKMTGFDVGVEEIELGRDGAHRVQRMGLPFSGCHAPIGITVRLSEEHATFPFMEVSFWLSFVELHFSVV